MAQFKKVIWLTEDEITDEEASRKAVFHALFWPYLRPFAVCPDSQNYTENMNDGETIVDAHGERKYPFIITWRDE